MGPILKRFPIGNFEFHLTFGDINNLPTGEFFTNDNRYSIHLPDYINSTMLMDPFSPDDCQKQLSEEIIKRTASLAQKIQDRTGEKVPIVGSFSVVHGSLNDFYELHGEMINEYKKAGIALLPQWLPPVAWYFGGAVKLEAMNNVGDIALLKKHGIPICMDVCHLCMGEAVFDFKSHSVIEELGDLVQHIHLADARGIDGEGLLFGHGDPKISTQYWHLLN